MKLEFQEYRARRILNVHKHVDGPWFWGKYTAHPYVGCRSGCEFCYLRGGRYLGDVLSNPDASQRKDELRSPGSRSDSFPYEGKRSGSFATLIRVKTNAADLLRTELSRLGHEVIACGDWQQPAEDRYRLSRAMLEVVHELGFPLFIVERSPLLTRDLDVLVEINRRTWVGVTFSISTVDPVLKQAFEPRSPGLKRRLQAMAELAHAGIQVGTALMPVLPFVGDDEAHLEDVVRATRDHGGSFVLGGVLTMIGVQARRTLEAARKLDPALEAQWRQMYNWEDGGEPSYSPPRAYSARLGLLIRELCVRHGLTDHMPRYVAPGPLAVNKRVAERLFLKTYDLELEGAQEYRIWAYRKAAWTVDEWPASIGEVYEARGQAGLQELPGIGESLSRKIAGWLNEQTNPETVLPSH
jgi:DNA repair photolyase